ncbi:hypothetical protein B0H19DRAFT_76272 [Mycena capillaripes]|nr:hypothetical protein B0H19DRAFT_76272 [Mycena capillaripes]
MRRPHLFSAVILNLSASADARIYAYDVTDQSIKPACIMMFHCQLSNGRRVACTMLYLFWELVSLVSVFKLQDFEADASNILPCAADLEPEPIKSRMPRWRLPLPFRPGYSCHGADLYCVWTDLPSCPAHRTCDTFRRLFEAPGHHPLDTYFILFRRHLAHNRRKFLPRSLERRCSEVSF